MENKQKRHLRRAIIFMVFALIFSSSISAELVRAEDVTEKVDFTITVEPEKDPYTANESITIKVAFSANTSTDTSTYVNGGDSFEVTWESIDSKVRFDANANPELVLYNEDGEPLADVVITATGAVVTFRDGVNTMSDISGNLRIEGRVVNNNVTGTEDGTVTIKINGEAKKSINIESGGADTGTKTVFKKTGYAYTEEDGTPVFAWTLLINMEYKEDFKGILKITDSLEGKGHVFVGDSDKIENYQLRVTDVNDQTYDQHDIDDGKDTFGYRKTTGYYYGTIVDYDWANHNEEFVVIHSPDTTMEGYLEDISFTSDGKTMTINIPASKVNGKFLEIDYYTVPIEAHNDEGGKYENSATLEYTDSEGSHKPVNASDSFKYISSGGDITGVPNESFKLVKLEEGTEKPIEGVTFKLTRKDGNAFRDGEKEKTVTTDKNGEALITNLAPGVYVVSEISAPEIYIVSDEKYEFEMVHDGISHTVYNVKKEEPPEEPPEDTEEPPEETTEEPPEETTEEPPEEQAPETTQVSVEKEWDDWNNLENKRPESVTIMLLADGNPAEGVEPLVLSEENAWKGSFDNLPKKSGDAEIEYTIEEVKVDYYVTEITGGDGSFVVKNVSRPWIPKLPNTPGGYGILTLKKTVSGSAEKDKNYSFTIEFKFPSGETKTEYAGLVADSTVTYDYLPNGTIAKVTETTTGYTTTYTIDGKSGDTCTIEGNKTSECVVNNDKKTEKKETPTPKTGDSSNAILWMGLIAVSILTMAVMKAERKHR